MLTMLLSLLIPVVWLGATDLRPAISQKEYKYTFVYLLLCTAALVIWILLSKDIPVPSPNKFIMKIIEFFVIPQE
jgi:hypothetical protein